jgi:hypothetical protein
LAFRNNAKEAVAASVQLNMGSELIVVRSYLLKANKKSKIQVVMQTVNSRAALKSLPLMKTGSDKSVIFRYAHLPVV